MSESLAAALVAAQARMPAVAKDSENPHFKSRFVSLDSLIAATRPVLNEHGLAISQIPVVSDAFGEPVLRTTLLHGPSGEQLEGYTPLFLGRADMQGFGAAITYARRYAWAAVLGIASEEDTDGNIPGAPPPSRAEPKPRTAERPPIAARPKRPPRMVTNPQKAKMAVLVHSLDEAASPIPADYAGAEDWIGVLKMRLQGEYGCESRTELTAEQASQLIDWLEAQAIPF